MPRGVQALLNQAFNLILTLIRIYPFIALTWSITGATAQPVPFDFEEWARGQLFPTPGTSAAGEIKCYNLPYGGIGFASHILTYWTIMWLGLGRKPLPPFSKLKHSWFDFILGCLSLLGSVPLAALSISACRHRWQFMLIAVWKLVMSITLNGISFHQSISLFNRKDVHEDAHFWWLPFYGLGVIVGMVGLLSLVAETFAVNHSLQIITYVFASITFVSAAIGVLWATASCLTCACRDTKENGWGGPYVLLGGVSLTVVLFGLLAALYSDWVLAAIAHNWSGSPSSDNAAIYWVYFVAKRLPLLSQ